MHDIRAIRGDPDAFDAALARRGLRPVAGDVLTLDTARRAALGAQQEHQARRNALAKEVGQGKRQGRDTTALEAEATALRDAMTALEERAAALDLAVRARLEVLPNILDADVPDGADEAANVVLMQHGAPCDLGFPAKEHFELGEALGEMLFEPAARMSGARFTILQGGLARMERALGQFMLDTQTLEHGYLEVSPPLLVNDAAAYGTDKLPKFAEDLFQTTDGRWMPIRRTSR